MHIPTARPESPSPLGRTRRAMKKAVDWVDRYTSPRPTTSGNFRRASYFQASMQGAAEGFYLFGPTGIVTGAGSAALGVAVGRKTGKRALGVLAGCAAGAALTAGLVGLFGSPVTSAAALVGGGLVGAFQTIRADSESRVRDSGGNATLISAAFLPGPAKMAGGIGASLASRIESKPLKALAGAGAGAALGAGLAAIGFTPVGVATAAVGGGLAGALGPFFGPRFSQFFRNLAEDIGKGVDRLGQKVGLLSKPLPEKTANSVGSVPSSFLKEGLRGFIYSDGSLVGFLVGGVMESIQQMHIAVFADRDSPGGAKQETPPGAA